MRIAIRDTYKALQPLKFCMQVRWGCAALSQERAAFSQASKAMLVFREISLMLCNRALGVAITLQIWMEAGVGGGAGEVFGISAGRTVESLAGV